jgi:hypothetical protein
VFTRFDPGTGRSRLFYASQVGGLWSTPSAVPINSAACNDDNAKIVGEVARGVTIYFESTRGDDTGAGTTCGQRTLYTATYANGAFSPVTRVPGIAVAGSDDSQPFATVDQRTLYFTSTRAGEYGVFTANRSGGTFTAIHRIVAPTTAQPFANNLVLVGEPSIVERPQGSLLYLMCGVAYDEHGGKTFGDADNIRLIPCVARRPK